jgi:hypothetical protein
MATVTILNLPATNTVDATTVAPVVYSGTTYKATLTTWVRLSTPMLLQSQPVATLLVAIY